MQTTIKFRGGEKATQVRPPKLPLTPSVPTCFTFVGLPLLSPGRGEVICVLRIKSNQGHDMSVRERIKALETGSPLPFPQQEPSRPIKNPQSKASARNSDQLQRSPDAAKRKPNPPHKKPHLRSFSARESSLLSTPSPDGQSPSQFAASNSDDFELDAALLSEPPSWAPSNVHEAPRVIGHGEEMPDEISVEQAVETSPQPGNFLGKASEDTKRLFGKFITNTAKVIEESKTTSQHGIRKVTEVAAPALHEAKNNLTMLAKNTATAAESVNQSLPVRGIKQVGVWVEDALIDPVARTIGLGGKDGLCALCAEFPIQAFQPAAECTGDDGTLRAREQGESEREHLFKTPLIRIIYNRKWCCLCRLFYRLLCLPENDPLLHPSVQSQTAFKGQSMEPWAENGSWYANSHWPFGYGYRRDFEADGIPALAMLHAPTGNQLVRVGIMYAGTTALAMAGRTPVNRQVTNHRKSMQSAKADLRSQPRIPLPCIISVKTKICKADVEYGLMFVAVEAYGATPHSPMTTFKSFRLRVEQQPMASARNDMALRYGRILDENKIDLSIARMWLHGCEHNDYHTGRCELPSWIAELETNQNRQQLQYIRVIDVWKNCIVKVENPAKCRYVTLSYVWGDHLIPQPVLKLRFSNLAELCLENSLLRERHNIIPQTIRDSMEVVKAVGEKYLWVDALCILQDENSQEQQNQMANMDRIYARALFTIVAADGAHANLGLSGISRPRSPPVNQIVEELDHGIHVMYPIRVPQDLGTSIWNTRAWTFQEKLLSRRLMIFSGGRVIWHCRTRVAREDMTADDSGHYQEPWMWLSLKPQYFGRGTPEGWVDGSTVMTRDGNTHVVRSATFTQYAGVVQEYTQRQLTYAKDMLLALSGLMHLFDLCFRSRDLHGLPETLLDVALLWRSKEPLSRRKIQQSQSQEPLFPSWAWAGWQGEIAYEARDTARGPETVANNILSENTYEGMRPILRYYTWDLQKTEFLPINNGAANPQQRGLGIPLQFKNKNEDLPILWKKARISALGGELSPPRAEDFPPGILNRLTDAHLVFWTSCSKPNSFKLSPVRNSRQYSIINAWGELSGSILLDSNGPKVLESGRHSLILMSEAHNFDTVNAWEYLAYNVMLVEWEPIGVIARRLGIGTIDKRCWSDQLIRLVCLA
jgi:hypothetical protein